ncbi:MAG: MMPL family transporter [Actinomycetes bacterium]
MATFLYRLGRLSARRRGIVVATWAVLLACLAGAAATFSVPVTGAITIPGTESQDALDSLARQFPQASGPTGTIVLAAAEGEQLTGPEAHAAVEATAAEAAALPGVVGAVDPFKSGALSPDGRYGLVQVQFAASADGVPDRLLERYLQTGSAAEAVGIRVEHGGEVLQGEPEVGSTEALGVAVAAVVLVLTLGSLVAAGMTMLTALLGVGTGMAALFAVSALVDMTSTAPVLALMLGLAVGIDYSLFITSRYRQNVVEGLGPVEAVGRAVGTAGSAVVFAGATVVIALAGLSVVGIPFLTVMGLAAAGTVTVAVLVALTLLPSLLAFAGHRALPRRLRSRAPAHRLEREPLGFRWGRAVMRHRVVAVLACVAGLGVLALPAADMRLALPDAGTAARGSDARNAYDLVSEGFGPGFNGRLAMVVSSPDPSTTAGLVGDVAAAVSEVPGVLAVTPPQLNAAGDVAVLTVVPTTGPSDAATEDVVHAVRATARPIAAAAGGTAALTGATAVGIDVSEKLADALPVYLLVVVGLSVVLLTVVFRSVLVPLKAAVGFLLTVGATFGATVAVFQRGWLSDLLGVAGTGPLVSFLPVLLIGILFGLAMDYEVFLVSRMREDFVSGQSTDETGRAHDRAAAAMVSGMGHGGRVVTAAAVIMTSVFAGFVLVEDPIIKSMGFALAFGVAVDAFVVRMTLVPAAMSLLGAHAWWLPRWLDRLLPAIDVEGSSLRAAAPAAVDDVPVDTSHAALIGDVGPQSEGTADPEDASASPAGSGARWRKKAPKAPASVANTATE